MTQAERIIAICHKALDPGPFGATRRGDVYKRFVAVGRPVDLSHIKTSCAVFAHGVLHFAGRLDRKPDIPGMGIFNGWLEGLTPSHPAWEDATAKDGSRRKPPPGAVFYRAYSKASSGKESHVGVLVFEAAEGQWITAEGGGGPTTAEVKEWGLSVADTLALNGTLCRMSAKPKDIWAKDLLGRILVGWWRPELLDGFVPEDQTPDFDAVSTTPTAPAVDDRILYTTKYVKEWQRLLGVDDDGKFGPGTLVASKKAIGK